MKYCSVVFDGNDREYTYQTEVEDLNEGDLCIVTAREFFAVVTFVKYLERPLYKGKLGYLLHKIEWDLYSEVEEYELTRN